MDELELKPEFEELFITLTKKSSEGYTESVRGILWCSQELGEIPRKALDRVAKAFDEAVETKDTE